MKSLKFKLLAVSIFAFGFSSQAQAICLDYWLKGPSACKEQEEAKDTIIIKGGKNINLNFEKDPERIAYEDKLNVEIDKFIEGYGKPPREFVAFHIDPTLENAIRWVKKFEDDYDRTRKIAVSWRQADKLFKEYKETGTLKLPPNSGVSEAQVKYLLKALEEDPSEYKDVKGFGNDLEGDWDDKVLSTDYSKLDYKGDEYSRATSKLAKSGNNSDYSLKALEARDRGDDSAKSTAKKDVKGAVQPLEISYYFSDKCKYCKKFKPQLKKAIDKYGKQNVKLTCVDMTPGEKTPDHIKGTLDCTWRPILAGEAKQYGIKSTPSLLVQRGQNADLELIENYYDADVVYNYFKNGGK